MRPTADRVREALFSILGGRVAGARVLDLFAGTGALGLEALSRGASSAVFVEPDPAARAVLERNVAALAAPATTVIGLDCRRAVRQLARDGRRFDLVFLDPPYGAGLAAAAAAELSRAGLPGPGAAIVVEESAREPDAPFPAGWERADDRRYGDTRITIYVAPGGPHSPCKEAQ